MRSWATSAGRAKSSRACASLKQSWRARRKSARKALDLAVNSSLQHLMKLVPPPNNPVAPGSPEAWKHVEEEMGTPLPQDFKDYIQVYGAGQWADFFGVMNPFYQWKHPQASKSWNAWFQLRFEGFSKLQKEYPQYQAPFRLHP